MSIPIYNIPPSPSPALAYARLEHRFPFLFSTPQTLGVARFLYSLWPVGFRLADLGVGTTPVSSDSYLPAWLLVLAMLCFAMLFWVDSIMTDMDVDVDHSASPRVRRHCDAEKKFRD